MSLHVLKRSPYFEALFLTLISGLVYLPYIPRLTYLLDEWYFIYDGVVAGPDIFHAMFSIDRPARGYFFDFYFSLFGPNPFPYHVAAYLWRLLAGLSAFRLFRTLWPDNRRFVFLTVLLFILYPGYSWWVSAIEYQPHIVSLALQVFSCLMTVEAIRASRISLKIIFLLSAILSGWAYIALVEYAIGMELFRFLCVYLIVSRGEPSLSVLRKILASLKSWSWNVLIPMGFMFWRLFLFENQRKTTDIDLLISRFQSAPGDTLGSWLANFLGSITTAGFYAWYKPFHANFTDARANEADLQLVLLAISILVLLVIAIFKLKDSLPVEKNSSWRKNSLEATLLGAASLAVGILPIVLANRYINLSFYSYYSLPASLGAAVLLMGLGSYLLSQRQIYLVMISAVLVLAGVTHLLLAKQTVATGSAIQNFWWQVSWRIPQLRPDTTLVTSYPYAEAVDNDLGLPEAANLIYFPDVSDELPIHYPVSTLMPSNASIDAILSPVPSKSTRKYRVTKVVVNYGNILILTQPKRSSCVRVIDGTQYVLSAHDPGNIGKIASYSRIENIRTQFDFQSPPEFAFGPEPAHGWCYYFEKADWAVQNLNWKEAARLGSEALALGLSPADQVEWFPLIQAYAMTNSEDKLVMISSQTQADPFFEAQVCEVFRQNVSRLALMPNISNTVERLFCD
jgi:hypothetical protein